uniref:Alpha2 protein n=1 Tax=Kimberley virus TaxID=318835 RepID=J9U0Z9_9RHAB|nr:alpha2 protein [Kimberley virus]
MIVGEIQINNIKIRKSSSLNKCHKIEIWMAAEELLTNLSLSRSWDKGLIDEMKVALSRKINQIPNWICSEDNIKVDIFYVGHMKGKAKIDYFELKKSIRPKLHNLGSLGMLEICLFWTQI